MVVVLSEFGRTFRENGSRGTDHGHGTVYWVLGGAINGGAIAGAQQRLTRGTLFQDRDYPVLNDYRARARRPLPIDVGAHAGSIVADLSADGPGGPEARLIAAIIGALPWGLFRRCPEAKAMR